MAAKTQLQPGGWGGRRYGSFAGRFTAPTYNTVVRLRGFVHAAGTSGTVQLKLASSGADAVVINVGSHGVAHLENP